MQTPATLSEDPNDFLFFDTETRALPGLVDPRWGDVTKSGAQRYASSCKVTIFRYCIGRDGPMRRWDLTDFDKTLRWIDAPPDLLKFLSRALKGEAWFVAWNSFFDRNVCNGGMIRPSKEPALPVRCVIDAMAQAAASNLPGKLEGASKAIGRGGKVGEGKDLIALFAPADGATPDSHPEEWARFQHYADVDVDELREVFFATRPLWAWEWEQFWTSEAINDAGLPMDKHFVERAAKLADVYAARVNELVKKHTRGHCWSVNQHVALAGWVMDNVEHIPEAADILVTKYEEDTDGDGLVASRLSLDRPRVEKLIVLLERIDREQGLTDEEYDVLLLLETRLYGASATPKKFAKLLPMLDRRDRLGGQYTFNGAQQTGRFSSRGVQMHNLTRAFVGMEEGKPDQELYALDFISSLETVDDDTLDDFEDRFGPAGRTLSRLIRPAILAPEKRTLGWGDWSAIEARVLPWLANSRGGNRVLDVFRKSDADPTQPDIYMIEASNVLNMDPDEMWRAYRAKDPKAKEWRQQGKVPVLSLGFGGGVGALQAMATAYGVSLTVPEAQNVVDVWRANNRWARAFWDKLWTAFLAAMKDPGVPYEAGRVLYLYDPGYLGGTMLCFLPDGRPLAYPKLRWAKREREDREGNVSVREELTYGRGYERRSLWYGVLAENITQAVAGSLLREALVRLSPAPPLKDARHVVPAPALRAPAHVIGHTHDEVLVETNADADAVARARAELRAEMERVPDWADGLPLVAEVSDSEYYSKVAG